MENNLVHKVYDFVNHLIHNTDKSPLLFIDKQESSKNCPVTGLDISMQPQNSKFLSYTGIKWYYENRNDIYKKVLLKRLRYKNKNLREQFKSIAHSIRNEDSNPRNYIRYKINELLDEKDCLFNNRNLIDKEKLKQAGMT